jgi:cobalt/nickel transport system ATP-binding protein
MSYIELKDICFSYGDIIALRHASLSVEKGEIVMITGPNGCGKSTLLNIMTGLIYPEYGEYNFEGIAINNRYLNDKKAAKLFHKKVGYIFQNSEVQLFCGNVFDEVAFGPMQMGLCDEEVKKRVTDCLTLLNITQLKERVPYHLSGGEKKKVAIASILAVDPDVLILDEPLSGLDRASKDSIIELLKMLHGSGKTIIVSTHDELLINGIDARIVVMDEEHKII